MQASTDIDEWKTLHPKFTASILRKKNLLSGINYTFRYKLRDAIDYTTPFSDTSEAMVVEGTEGTVSPMPRQVSGGESGTVSIEWDNIPDAKYEIRMSINNGVYKAIGTVQNNTVRKRNLSPEDDHAFLVVCVFEDDRVVWHSRASKAMKASPPVTAFIANTFPKSLIVKSNPRTNFKERTVVDTAIVLGKARFVMIYFSAHWCGPCRQFTPMLAKFYNEHKANYNFEVVFVSCDRSEGEMLSYFEEDHPWCAVDHGDDKREEIQGHYRVNGIPACKVVSRAGVVLEENAVQSGLTERNLEKWAEKASSGK